MKTALPDKWIRKAIYDACNGMTVDGKTINVYDHRVPSDAPEAFIVITTQNNQVEKSQKCNYRYRSFTNIEINVRELSSGNPGSRLLADNVLDEVRSRTDELSLDASSNLKIITQTEFFPDDLIVDDDVYHIYRKFVQYELLIN